MNIGIIGYGFVGKAIETGFKSKCSVYINDPKFPYESIPLSTMTDICEFIFISVPTPWNEKKGFDGDIINGVFIELNMYCKEIDYTVRPIIIIKSAVIPSEVEKFLEKYIYLRFIVSPEYLSDNDAERMFVNQKQLVLGGNDEDCFLAKLLYGEYSICNIECPVGICDQVEASILKSMENSMLAMKVVYMNEFYRYFEEKTHKGSRRWSELMRIFHYDERMGTSHYQVPGPDGDFGFGGRCLPKDIRAIIRDGDLNGTPMNLLKSVWLVNKDFRTSIDWEKEET